MKNLLKFFFTACIFSLVVVSCGDDEEPENNCTTDPAVTVEENIIGTWVIDGDKDETITFRADGTGNSSEESFRFSASNEGKDYHNFDWEMEDENRVVIIYDYSPDVPTLPFIISEDYEVLKNECDEIEMQDPFNNANTILLTK